MTPLRSDRGIALVIALMAILFMSALGAALVMTTSAEALIASSFRTGQQAIYAADAAAEWALADLAAVAPDWPTLLDGGVRSPFVDGPPSGRRTLADGSVVDLESVVAANPGWMLYAFGPLAALLPASNRQSPFYIVVFVAAHSTAPERLRVKAEAFGPRGARRAVELEVSRGPGGARLESWHQVR